MQGLIADFGTMTENDQLSVGLAFMAYASESDMSSFRPRADLEMDTMDRSMNVNFRFKVSYDQMRSLAETHIGMPQMNLGWLSHIALQKTVDDANDKRLLERLATTVNNDPEMNKRMNEKSPELMRLVNQRLADKQVPIKETTRAKVRTELGERVKARKAGGRQLAIRKSGKSEKPEVD